jgi:hypothetical protein
VLEYAQCVENKSKALHERGHVPTNIRTFQEPRPGITEANSTHKSNDGLLEGGHEEWVWQVWAHYE